MKIAFASCCKIGRTGQGKQPIWGIIKRQKPDLLLLMGDNVYIGKEGYEASSERKWEILTNKYDAQTKEAHFKDLLNKVPYLAMWDNHDFGLPGKDFVPKKPNGPNLVPPYGADVSIEHRQMALSLFNTYLGANSQQPPTDEIYCTHTIVDENKREIKFYMVDVRSHQEDPNQGPRISPSLLGKKQEDWLLNELRTSTADIDIICSGLPYKYWGKYPEWHTAFEIVASKRSKLLFLAGQVHHNEFNTHGLRNSSCLFPFWIKTKKMFEAVSSGVGQNLNFPNENDEDDEEELLDNESENVIENIALFGLPRNNYGIIDITEKLVLITLYGQSAINMHYAVINRQRWSLKGYWKMKS
jgi:hypothetical protein